MAADKDAEKQANAAVNESNDEKSGEKKEDNYANDDFSDTPNIIEHQEGYPYAFPYVVVQGWSGKFHAKPIDNNIISNEYLM